LTTQAGKTTTAVSTKFLYMVKKTTRKKHLIAGDSLGTVVSNILLNGDCGLLDNYPEIQMYLNGSNEQKLPHLKIGDDTIYLVGYADIGKFKKVLGGQFGAIFIDEINIADMGFVRELFLPRFEYMLCTLNPDNPAKEIYEEIINRARPIDKYKDSVPGHMWNELNKSPQSKGWHYWYLTFDDNPAMTAEMRDKLLTSLLPETREYKTKILGIRTKGVGLIFSLPQKNIISRAKAKEFQYQKFTCGVDTSYSRESKDTFAFQFIGITNCGKCITLAEKVFNNKDLDVPMTPSDIAVELARFIEEQQKLWGVCPSAFIDSADQATLTECQKHKRVNNYNWYYFGSYKKMRIIDRINLQNSWIASGDYLIVDECKELIREHNQYSWKPNKDEPEDANDHTINANQYGWLPYKTMIGVKK
jgi:phage terminase large subunit